MADGSDYRDSMPRSAGGKITWAKLRDHVNEKLGDSDACLGLEDLVVEIRTVIEEYDNSLTTLNGVLDTELINKAKTTVAEAALTWATGNVVHVLKTQNEKSKKRKLLSDAVAFLGTHYSSEESFDPAIKEQVKKGRMF